MDKLFKLKRTVQTFVQRVLAGLTTFFAMSYILFVNPQILSQTGMPAQGVFLATIIGAVVGTLMMAFMLTYLMPKRQVWGLMPSLPLQSYLDLVILGKKPWLWSSSVVLSH